MNKNTLVLVILITVFVIIFIYVIYLFNTEASRCMSSPLVYGAGKFKNANMNYEFICSCRFNAPNSPDIEFDSQKIIMKNINYSVVNFNISDLIS